MGRKELPYDGKCLVILLAVRMGLNPVVNFFQPLLPFTVGKFTLKLVFLLRELGFPFAVK